MFLTAEFDFDPDRGDNCFIFGWQFAFFERKTADFAQNSTAAITTSIFYVSVFIALFWSGVIDVIGRYFEPITLGVIAKRLILLEFSGKRYRRYRRYRGGWTFRAWSNGRWVVLMTRYAPRLRRIWWWRDLVRRERAHVDGRIPPHAESASNCDPWRSP